MRQTRPAVENPEWCRSIKAQWDAEFPGNPIETKWWAKWAAMYEADTMLQGLRSAADLLRRGGACGGPDAAGRYASATMRNIAAEKRAEDVFGGGQ